MKTRSFKTFALRTLFLLAGLYIAFLILIYIFQEKLLFQPQPVPEYVAHIDPSVGIEEHFIDTGDGAKLHGLLFRAKAPKGLIFYLHGNGGNCYMWAEQLTFLGDSGYDVFILDYRGYGKSTGSVSSEEQLHSDIDKAYAEIAKTYNEQDVVIAGYSMGTGLAAHLAMNKNIKALVLEAPYYSLSKLSSEKVPLLPEFIKRYKIKTNTFLPHVSAPVYIFHGTGDALIPFTHSEQLKAENPVVTLVPVNGAGHNGINESTIFQDTLTEILR